MTVSNFNSELPHFETLDNKVISDLYILVLLYNSHLLNHRLSNLAEVTSTQSLYNLCPVSWRLPPLAGVTSLKSLSLLIAL